MLFASGVFSLYNDFMSLTLELVRDFPVGCWLLDDSSPFQDYSGHQRPASGGAATRHAALVNGSTNAAIVSSTDLITFTVPVFLQGQEASPFGLEAFFRVISPSGDTAEQQVLGHYGAMDGLTVDGTVVSFVTKYLTAPEARCSFDLQVPRSVQAVGIHTYAKNSLYVDGELVAEVDLTEEQQSDLYVATNGSLVSGTVLGTQQLAINALTVFAHALPEESIKRHFAMARKVVDTRGVSTMYGGEYVQLSRYEDSVFLEMIRSTQEDWLRGYREGTVVIDDQLRPEIINDVSITSAWLDSFALDSAETTSIYGVNMTWDGEGAVVEASLDGISWESVSRGKNLDIIPPGFNPTDQELQIRVSFPGGIINDESYVDNLSITGFTTGEVVADTRTITYVDPAYPEYDHEVIEFHENWGVEIRGGTVVISESTEPDDSGPKTLEVWIKNLTIDGFTTNFEGTTYINGTPGTTVKRGEWTLYHIASPTAHGGNITFNGNVQVGHAVLYDNELTAAQIAEIYSAYTGIPTFRAGDNSIVALTQSPTAAEIYAHDWTITGAG